MSPTPSNSNPSLLVLLIEPVDERASQLERQLSAGGFEVIRTTNLQDARTCIDEEMPEAILLGGEYLQAEQRDETRAFLSVPPSLPVMAVTQNPPSVTDAELVNGWATQSTSDEELVARLLFALQDHADERAHSDARDSLRTMQRMGRMGSWKLLLETGELYCSEAACSLLGIDYSESAHSPDVLLSSAAEEHEAEVRGWLESLFAGQGSSLVEYGFDQADGTTRRIRLRADQLVDTERGQAISGIAQDCTPGLDPEHAVELVNTNDPLTGLPNRKQFLQCLERAIAEAFDTQEQIAILFLEVEADETPGKELSLEQREELLVRMVQRLKEDLRGFDVLGQPGADEFELGLSRVGNETLTVLLREQVRSQDAYKVSRRIRQSTDRTVLVDGDDVKVNFNIGIAVYPGDAESALGMVKCAEEAMYCAKQHGRNNIQFYTSSMNTATFESLTLEASLRRAIENDELAVFYQPKVEIATNKIIGMEALVRWKHPELGMVSPAQFIPIAEETGLIIPIGEFVLRTACRQNKLWQEQGLDPIRMAVNLSSIQFRRPDLFDNVIGVLEEFKLDPEWLELEITESILLKNVEATISALHRLKRAGIHLSIDDFGTGYSSLSYLKRFPVDTLKIDQSFIREVTSNADDASITTSIILMGHSLKLKVIAEGVETKSQLAFLRVLECDEVQGYFFSAPVPAEEATALLETSFAKEGA